MQQTVELEVYHTRRQIAQRCHTTTRTVDIWLAQGLLKKTKASKRTLIAERDFQIFLRESTERQA